MAWSIKASLLGKRRTVPRKGKAKPPVILSFGIRVLTMRCCEKIDPETNNYQLGKRTLTIMEKRNCAQNVPKKRLYSIKELVSEIGATEWFWRTQIWDGQLPYVQIGRKMLIDRRDIETFIRKNKTSN